MRSGTAIVLSTLLSAVALAADTMAPRYDRTLELIALVEEGA